MENFVLQIYYHLLFFNFLIGETEQKTPLELMIVEFLFCCCSVKGVLQAFSDVSFFFGI